MLTTNTPLIRKPNNAPVVKQKAVRGYGADVVLCEPTGEARDAAAQLCVEKFSGYFIHPSDDEDIMSGQGTVAVELLEQVAQDFGVHLDAIVVPVGGGGLCSGIAMAAKVSLATVLLLIYYLVLGELMIVTS